MENSAVSLSFQVMCKAWFSLSHVSSRSEVGFNGLRKNLNNGDVEVVACGTPERLEELYLWLQEGPKTASVRQVRRLSSELEHDYQGFEIL